MNEIKFEKALEKLEKIVRDLETGQLSLDDSMKQYEEGIALSRLCSKKLDEAQKKIEILMKKADGCLEKKPFDFEAAVEEQDAPAGRSKTAKLRKKDKTDPEELDTEDELPF